MEKAVGILRGKVREGKPIRIVGDYDIDGVCSTYLLYRALKRVGANVDFEIPDRIKAVSYTHLDVYKRQYQHRDDADYGHAESGVL